ncbi:MAG: hypothetical protein V1908_00880 [Candidatus Peregrinibacteria bacterium]
MLLTKHTLVDTRNHYVLMPGVLQKAIVAVHDLHNRLVGNVTGQSPDMRHVNRALKDLNSALHDSRDNLQYNHLPVILTSLESLCTLDLFEVVDFGESLTQLGCIADFLNNLFLDTHRNERLEAIKMRINNLVSIMYSIIARLKIVDQLSKSPALSDNLAHIANRQADAMLRNHYAKQEVGVKPVILN